MTDPIPDLFSDPVPDQKSGQSSDQAPDPAPDPAALAGHLRGLRTGQGLTLQVLADRSGVSRAALSRIETGEVSPTAETLGRLATALGLPVSMLIAPLDSGFRPLMRRAAQPVWRDPATGFERRGVSPPARGLRAEMIEGRIGPGQRISYEAPGVPGQEHHLLMLSGALTLTLGTERHLLGPGDCLRYRLFGPSRFETGPEEARYVIALV